MSIEHKEGQDIHAELNAIETSLLANLDDQEVVDMLNQDSEKAAKEKRSIQSLEMEKQIAAGIHQPDAIGLIKLEREKQGGPIHVETPAHSEKPTHITYEDYISVGGKVEQLTQGKQTLVVDFSGSMDNKSLGALYTGIQTAYESGSIGPDTQISLIYGMPHMQESYTAKQINQVSDQVTLMTYEQFLDKVEELGYTKNHEWIESNLSGTGSTPLLASIGEALLDPATSNITIFGDGGSDLSANNTGSVEHNYKKELAVIVEYALVTKKTIDLVLYNTPADHEERIAEMVGFLDKELGDQFHYIQVNDTGSKSENIHTAMERAAALRQQEKVRIVVPLVEEASDHIPEVNLGFNNVSQSATDVYEVGRKVPEPTFDLTLPVSNDGTVSITRGELEQLFPGYHGGTVGVELFYGYRASAGTAIPQPATNKKDIYTIVDTSGSMSDNVDAVRRGITNVYGDVANKNIGMDIFSGKHGYATVDMQDTSENLEKRVGGNTPGFIAATEFALQQFGISPSYEMHDRNGEQYTKGEQNERFNTYLDTHISQILKTIDGAPATLTETMDEDSIQELANLFISEANKDNPFVQSLLEKANTDTLLVTDFDFNTLNLGDRSRLGPAIRTKLNFLFSVLGAVHIKVHGIDIEGDSSGSYASELIKRTGGDYKIVPDGNIEKAVEEKTKDIVLERLEHKEHTTIDQPTRARFTWQGKQQVVALSH